jgi:hypothetical protein
MADKIYSEELRSNKTSLLFFGLMILFLGLFTWQIRRVGLRSGPIIFIFLAIFFAFYVLNYRTLKIKIDDEMILLKFGIVRWRTKLDNVASCGMDDSSLLIKYGGAGVHFAFTKGKYRAFFNFLEGPRVLVSFHQKQGWVQELVLSTTRPDQVLQYIKERIGE